METRRASRAASSVLLLACLLSVPGWADYSAGQRAYERGDYATALKECLPPATAGDPNAQFRLGFMYAHGLGVPQNFAEAIRWYRKAADQGSAVAEHNLAVRYAFAVPPNFAEALRWYRKAADQGYAHSQSNLGVMYYQGQGVPQDYAEAVRWWRRAADQGVAPALDGLGDAYRMGRGVRQDDAEAVRWYRKAADQGLAEALSNLGDAYRRGQGVRQDDAEAIRLYRKAADQGLAEAQLNLGNLYSAGRGVAQDNTAAVGWYRKAADQGLASAQILLGRMYRDGTGVPQNYVQARMWLDLAATKGDAAAAEVRDETTKGMTPGQIAESQRLVREWKSKAPVDPGLRPTQNTPVEHVGVAAPVESPQSVPVDSEKRKGRTADGERYGFSRSGSTAKYNNVFVGQSADDPAIKESGCEFVPSLEQTFMEILEHKQPWVCGLASNHYIDYGAGGDYGPKTVQTILVLSRASFQDVLASLAKAYGAPLPGLHQLTDDPSSGGFTTWLREDGTAIAAKQNHATNRGTGETVRFSEVMFLKRK